MTIEPQGMSTKLNFPQLRFGKFNFIDMPLGSIYSYWPLRSKVLNIATIKCAKKALKSVK